MRTILVTAIALAFAGCSNGVSNSFLGGPLVEPGKAVGTLTVTNGSGVSLTAITISKCNAMSHGLNRMKSGERVASGASRTFQLSDGCWDVMAGYNTYSGSATGKRRITMAGGAPINITFQ